MLQWGQGECVSVYNSLEVLIVVLLVGNDQMIDVGAWVGDVFADQFNGFQVVDFAGFDMFRHVYVSRSASHHS